MNPILLGVNIDHIATLRQVRGTTYPNPVEGALIAEAAGADGITLHLREDRRHIQDQDVLDLSQVLKTRMNLEMAVTEEMLSLAERIRPAHCCLVPEKREELTTEGGLHVIQSHLLLKDVCERLQSLGIEVSLFIDPDEKQLEAAATTGASTVEIHTGEYANATDEKQQQLAFQRILRSVEFAKKAGFIVNAGHGLHYENVKPIAAIPEINELNIGHAIVARALWVGLETAVKEMKALMVEARKG